MPLRVKKQEQAPPRIVLYGPEGIGKTTFGAESENPIFICTEDGATSIPVDKIEFSDGRARAEAWPEIIQALKDVANEDHNYKTVVIDTWNYAVAMAANLVCERSFGRNWDKFLAYGGNQGWAATTEEMKPALNLLDACRAKGMTVILLAHDGTQKIPDPIQGDYARFTGDMDKRTWNLVAQWADCVGHASYKYTVVETRDAQGNAKKGRAVQNNTTRVVRWQGTAAEAAKCRVGYELPAELPLSFSLFHQHLGHDTYTLEQIKTLWHVLPQNKVPEVLAWLGVERLEQAPVFKLRQLLTRLQSRAAEMTTTLEEETNAAA